MFKFEPDKTYHMPISFGGCVFDPHAAGVSHDTTSASCTITTDPKKLEDYLPPGFKLLRPELVINYMQLRECDFLAGSAYNLIITGVPARFMGRKDRLQGLYALVLWENNTKPILTGREENGLPKIYSEIEDIKKLGNEYYGTATYEGHAFMKLSFHDPVPVDDKTLEALKQENNNSLAFGWRYIPNVDGPGAALSQPISFPQTIEITSAFTCPGQITWQKIPNERNVYTYDSGNIAHIVDELASLPIYKASPITLLKGTVIMHACEGHVLK